MITPSEKMVKATYAGNHWNQSEYEKYIIENQVKFDNLQKFLDSLDINQKSSLYYENPKIFMNLLFAQRLLRKLDEVYLFLMLQDLI